MYVHEDSTSKLRNVFTEDTCVRVEVAAHIMYIRYYHDINTHTPIVHTHSSRARVGCQEYPAAVPIGELSADWSRAIALYYHTTPTSL